MTEAEIRLATNLLDAEQENRLAEVRVGRWVLANSNGVYGVYSKKAEAIDDALSGHAQNRDKCKVKRLPNNTYSVSILDVDEDPCEKFYHTYSLYRITSQTLAETRELAICGMLPEEYFSPYTELYRVVKEFCDGKIAETEAVARMKELGYIDEGEGVANAG